MKKYYAIRYKNGNTAIEYDSWDIVKKKVVGVKGVVYKGFYEKADADIWIQKDPVPYARDDSFVERDSIYLYVDGSYSSNRSCSGWGWVCVQNDNILGENFGVIQDPPESRNIAGELKATMEGVYWTWNEVAIRKFTIVHDYMGISSWPLGYWQAKKNIPALYIKFMKPYMQLLNINFIKVSGHSGIKWNEYVDMLTRKGYTL